MTWQPVVLLGFAGLVLGGAISTWKNGSRVVSVILGLVAAALAAGGVVWVLGE